MNRFLTSTTLPARSARMLILFFTLVTLGAMIFENRFIFAPESANHDLDLGFPVEYVTFEASDGVKLHGAFIPVENARGTILWCHGNGGNLTNGLDMARQFRNLGMSVFLFDYRGYGKSQGSPTGDGVIRDAEAAYTYLTETLKLPASRIILLGESLGGAPAIQLASRHDCAALILQSTFTSIRDMAKVVFPYFPWLRFFVRTDFANLATIPYVKAPKLLIHSRTDEVVPFWMGEKLFAAATEPKEFWVIDGAGHNGTFGQDGYLDRIRTLLDRVLP